jgi:hypothetical protein
MLSKEFKLRMWFSLPPASNGFLRSFFFDPEEGEDISAKRQSPNCPELQPRRVYSS